MRYNSNKERPYIRDWLGNKQNTPTTIVMREVRSSMSDWVGCSAKTYHVTPRCLNECVGGLLGEGVGVMLGAAVGRLLGDFVGDMVGWLVVGSVHHQHDAAELRQPNLVPQKFAHRMVKPVVWTRRRSIMYVKQHSSGPHHWFRHSMYRNYRYVDNILKVYVNYAEFDDVLRSEGLYVTHITMCVICKHCFLAWGLICYTQSAVCNT